MAGSAGSSDALQIADRAKVTVRLPAIDGRQPAVEGADAESPHANPRRVLLVEDNGDAREMLRQVLEMSGHDVFEAADGTTGVEVADAQALDVGSSTPGCRTSTVTKSRDAFAAAATVT
jgi:PleD family two-component response regulator